MPSTPATRCTARVRMIQPSNGERWNMACRVSLPIPYLIPRGGLEFEAVAARRAKRKGPIAAGLAMEAGEQGQAPVAAGMAGEAGEGFAHHAEIPQHGQLN